MIDYSKLVTKEMKDAKALQEVQEKENMEAREFLKDDDWRTIRELELLFGDQFQDQERLTIRAQKRSEVNE